MYDLEVNFGLRKYFNYCFSSFDVTLYNLMHFSLVVAALWGFFFLFFVFVFAFCFCFCFLFFPENLYTTILTVLVNSITGTKFKMFHKEAILKMIETTCM